MVNFLTQIITVANCVHFRKINRHYSKWKDTVDSIKWTLPLAMGKDRDGALHPFLLSPAVISLNNVKRKFTESSFHFVCPLLIINNFIITFAK